MPDFGDLGPLSFRLAGERFALVPDPPSDVLVDAVLAVSTDVHGYRRYDIRACVRFVRAVVPETDHERLATVLSDKGRQVETATLGSIVMWAVEELTLYPFGSARALALHAATNWGYLRGRLLNEGVPTKGWSARDLLDLVYARAVADQTGLVGVHRIRADLDLALANSWIDRESFGMDADALDAIPPAAPRVGDNGGTDGTTPGLPRQRARPQGERPDVQPRG